MKTRFFTTIKDQPYRKSRKGGLTKTQRKLFKALHKELVERTQASPEVDPAVLLRDTRNALYQLGFHMPAFWIDTNGDAWIRYTRCNNKKHAFIVKQWAVMFELPKDTQ